MDVACCRSRADYFALVNGPQFTVRWMLESHLARRHAGATSFAVPGFCAACTLAVDFGADFAGAWHGPDGLLVPNWRECLRCPACGMSGRQRMTTELITGAVLELTRPPEPRAYMMEALSPLFAWTRRSFPWLELVGSEYLGPGTAGGVLREGVRHEDAEHLSFPDASFDLVVSCDVLEHVDDPLRAFREVARVLRPGGRVVMTFPMDPHLDRNVRRAGIEGGTVRHHLPPVYHGNPLSPAGSLVFTDFGWEVLDHMCDAGLLDPTLNVYWSYERGYLGIQFYFVAGRA